MTEIVFLPDQADKELDMLDQIAEQLEEECEDIWKKQDKETE